VNAVADDEIILPIIIQAQQAIDQTDEARRCRL
jgi:hypothetical protein